MGFVQGRQWGCDCIQIYLTPSRTWNVPELSVEEIKQFKAFWKNTNVKQIVAHIPFLVNIASDDEELRQRSVERLVLEVNMANKLQVEYLVLHPGSTRNRKEGIERIIEGLNIATERKYDFMPKILLETMSGQGNMLCSRFEDIAEIIKKVENPDHIGVCLDTAHLFIAGYDFIGYAGYEKTLQTFDKIVGINTIKVIHLNDSKTSQGSHNDRHAAIGEGKMGLQIFHALLNDKRFENIPKILEIPERDEKSYDTLQLLRELKSRKSVEPQKVELSTQNLLEEHIR